MLRAVQRQIRGLLLAAMVAGLFAAIPVFASASTSSYGANYAYNSGYTLMYICDQETDNRNAYTVFDTTSSGTGLRRDDHNGHTAPCYNRSVVSAITQHVVCEDVSYSSDPCGAWMRT
jgi:hypothetical protein